MGQGHKEAMKWQYQRIETYGLKIREILWIWRASQLIRDLESGISPEEAAKNNGITEWELCGPSPAQMNFLTNKGIKGKPKSKRDAGLLLDAKLNPIKVYRHLIGRIDKALTHQQLNGIAVDLRLVKGTLQDDWWDQLAEAGKEKRKIIGEQHG